MFLGIYGIDEYVAIPAVTHKFSTGAAFAPSAITYSIYEEGSTTGTDEDVDMTPASPFDSVVGLYYARRQLTAAAGFEANKTYIVVVKATVDSVAAIDVHVFQIRPLQTGDSYAVVTNADYGLAKLVRSTTPANTLTVDANHLVGVPATQDVNTKTITAGIIANASFNADVGSTAYATNIIALAVRKVLDELNLDHLCKVDTTVAADGDLTTYVVDGSILSHIMTAGADTSDYAASTDSLEKAGDNGAAILTDTGTTLDGKIDTIDGVVDLIEDIVRNKMEITDLDGALVLRADNNTDVLYTVAACITDNSTTTIRKRIE